jgi:hypothetical protein
LAFSDTRPALVLCASPPPLPLPPEGEVEHDDVEDTTALQVHVLLSSQKAFFEVE